MFINAIKRATSKTSRTGKANSKGNCNKVNRKEVHVNKWNDPIKIEAQEHKTITVPALPGIVEEADQWEVVVVAEDEGDKRLMILGI